jgi:uncharacterized tellurite resistance protein B-like protein
MTAVPINLFHALPIYSFGHVEGKAAKSIAMNLKTFSDQQRQALLDLAMLAMYADGHLAATEDERLVRLLTAMGFTTEYDRGKHFDASVSRVSRHSSTAASARTHALALARKFTSREQRREVQNVLDDLVRSDDKVAPQETNFLSTVREALQV